MAGGRGWEDSGSARITADELSVDALAGKRVLHEAPTGKSCRCAGRESSRRPGPQAERDSAWESALGARGRVPAAAPSAPGVTAAAPLRLGPAAQTSPHPAPGCRGGSEREPAPQLRATEAGRARAREDTWPRLGGKLCAQLVRPRRGAAGAGVAGAGGGKGLGELGGD